MSQDATTTVSESSPIDQDDKSQPNSDKAAAAAAAADTPLERIEVKQSNTTSLKHRFKAAKYCILRNVLACLAYCVSMIKRGKKPANLPPVTDYNLVTPAVKLSQQIKSGHLSSEEVVESFIERIRLVNPVINAVVDKRFESALREARDIDRRLDAARDGEGDLSILKLPLVGVPLSVKETIGVDGYSFTGGVVGRRAVKAPENADTIDLLMKAGVIPIGLTNIPEMTLWWDTNNKLYGKTLNPYDLSRIPGGSSGGEAALLASAGSVVGIGSDLGGSIRMPCNFCGLFGHKPTPFTVSIRGLYPRVKGPREKLLGVGPMTRYACDLAPMLKIMAGKEAHKLRLDDRVDLKKLRVYYVEDLGDPMAAKCDEEILDRLRQAADFLASKSADEQPAEKVEFEEFSHGFFLWSANAPTIEQQEAEARNEPFAPAREIAKKCVGKSEHSYRSIAHETSKQLNMDQSDNMDLREKAEELRKKFNELVGDNGVLLVPTHPEIAPKDGTTLMKCFNISYTLVTTVLLAPITQCPLGFNQDGLPFGVQIIGRPYNDKLTLAVAAELEKEFGGWKCPSPVDV